MNLAVQTALRQKKHAFCFSGGAFNGSLQIGMEEVLEKYGITPSIVAGTSIGYVNAVFKAMGKEAERNNMWIESGTKGHEYIWTSDIITEKNGKISVNRDTILKYAGVKTGIFNKLGLLFKGVDKVVAEVLENISKIESLADNDPLFQILLKHIDINAMKIPCIGNFVDYDTGNEVTFMPQDFSSNRELAKAGLASATMPLLWPSVKDIQLADGTSYGRCYDGGVRSVSAISSVLQYIDKQTDDDISDYYVWMLNCSNTWLMKQMGPKGIMDVAGRTYEIFMDEMLRNDLNRALEINWMTSQVTTRIPKQEGGYYRNVKLIAMQPFENELGNSLDSSLEAVHRKTEIGRKRAEEVLQSINLFGLQ